MKIQIPPPTATPNDFSCNNNFQPHLKLERLSSDEHDTDPLNNYELITMQDLIEFFLQRFVYKAYSVEAGKQGSILNEWLP